MTRDEESVKRPSVDSREEMTMQRPIITLLLITVAGCTTIRMESKMTSTKATEVNREGSRVWIDGVPRLSYGESCETTYVGALAAALAGTEHPVSETQIMGLSGLAFRVRWAPRSEGGWCGSIPVGEFPEERQATARLTGWDFADFDEVAKWDEPHMERYVEQMTKSIDGGVPFVGYPPPEDANCATAVGYERNGDAVSIVWQTYRSGDKTTVLPIEKTGPWVMIPKKFRGAVDRRHQLIEALRIAVRNWHRGQTGNEDGKYAYLWGERAMTEWVEHLRAVDQLSEKQRGSMFFLNWWNFDCYNQARMFAAKFLREYVSDINGEAKGHLGRAADLYQQIYDGPHDISFRQKLAFYGPWTGKKMADWAKDVQEREAKILEDVLKLEKEAIVELEAVLRALSG